MSKVALAAVGLFFVVAGLGCVASTPTGECLSYSCDEEGAKAMLWAEVDSAYKPSDRAKKALEQAIDGGVSRMKGDQGFTPESFDLARGNIKKFLDEVPDAGEDALGPAAEDLAGGTLKLCPLWPFC